jgi:hypothetical protein
MNRVRESSLLEMAPKLVYKRSHGVAVLPSSPCFVFWSLPMYGWLVPLLGDESTLAHPPICHAFSTPHMLRLARQ